MESPNSKPSSLGDRRLAVVSGYGLKPLTPRGQRTQWLLRSLERNWDVELTALPAQEPSAGAAPGNGRTRLRRAAAYAVRMALLDKWEPWSARQFVGWRPEIEGAVLIAYPWSPVAYAARRLQRAGIPYVIDTGDPWVLTSPGTDTMLLAKYRVPRAERAIWGGAAGAVVTTSQQAEAISKFFPDLSILVRPNGYDPVPTGIATEAVRSRDPEHLRLVHYGMLSFVRVDVSEMLARLAESGRWKKITFTQYGDDHAGMLAKAPPSVEVEYLSPQPWNEVLAGASRYDLAVVVGNWVTGQLPSKAVQYMTLPIPRLALVERKSDDALAEYVEGRSGWLALAKEDPEAARLVWEHAERDWTESELAPPTSEIWPEVADRIAEFVERCVGGTTTGQVDGGQVADRISVGRGEA